MLKPQTQKGKRYEYKTQKQIREVSQIMGRQRNKPQPKGKEESSGRMLNEIEASQLSDIEFKSMVIRKRKELSVNYQKLHRNYEELTANYNSIKRI